MSLRLPKNKDARIFLWVCLATVTLILVIAIFAPESGKDDPRPTTTNAGPQGAKAAYLLLEAMGRKPQRWEHELTRLSEVDAAHTTLVIAEPMLISEPKELTEALRKFLERGGRVVATGVSGAEILPDAKVMNAGLVQKMTESSLCDTTPQGPGELARAGEVQMADNARWAAEGLRFHIEQTCAADGVVVRYAVGKGEAIWWSSATPLTNAGLKNDGALRLFLASIGDERKVYFDESLHGFVTSMWDAAKGLPLGSLKLQAILLGLLLILSFSRRRGPVRAPVTLPRSSPVEFAESMGDLYEKAGAHVAAIDAARRKLVRVVVQEVGLAPNIVERGPEEVAAALEQRLGGEWQDVSTHLQQADAARHADLKPHAALLLVRSMSEDGERVRTALKR